MTKYQEINGLMRKDDVVKKTNIYIHNISIKYPKENVESMIKSWNKSINEYSKWLKKYPDVEKQALSDALNNFDKTIISKQKSINEFEAMSDEDKFKKLIEQYKKDKEEFLKVLKDKDKLREELKNNTLKELNKYKQKALNEMNNKINAVKLWSKQ